MNLSKVIKTIPAVFKYPRDHKDEKSINLATEAEVDFIVTWDNDLLDLMTGTETESKQFRLSFRNIKIVRKDEFLRKDSESGLSLDY